MEAQIAVIGADPGIFDRRYVALMPGLGWLPHAGSDVPAGDPRTHPADYFEVDLEVEVPEGWLVAGPGRRETLGSGGGAARFRFRPGAPVPHVGLLASRFERRAIEAAGVEVEILVHPGHDRNLRFFADAAGEIRQRVEEIFGDAERLGLPYPYGGLTLVESPTSLRGYGGGWRMDTTQALPGVLLLRENAFTTSRFELEFIDPDSFEGRDGGLARAKVEALERFFENDVSGGNVFLGGSRNFLLYQTGARGEGALAIDFVLDELANRLLTGKAGYFSAFMFRQESSALIGQVITDMMTGRMDTAADAVLAAASDRPSVWDRALGASLADLDPTGDAEAALNVLALKSRAIARSIPRRPRAREDGGAAGRAARPLPGPAVHGRRSRAARQGARRRPRPADRRLAARGGAAGVRRLAGRGRTAGRRRAGRSPLPDAGPRAQRRGRPGAAAHALRHRRRGRGQPLAGDRAGAGGGTRDGRDRDAERDAAGRALAAAVSVAQPAGRAVDPAAGRSGGAGTRGALPRQPSQRVAAGGDGRYRGRRPRPGILRRVRRRAERRTSRRGGCRASSCRRSTWTRGCRRRTSSSARPPNGAGGSGPRAGAGTGIRWPWSGAAPETGAASSRPSCRRAGRWRLALHLPEAATRQGSASPGPGVLISVSTGLWRLGNYDLTLIAGGEERALEFDAAAAETGWNTLGEFDLSKGAARVVVSNQSSGSVVIADAVRWQLVREDP